MIPPIYIVGFSGNRPSVEEGRTSNDIVSLRDSLGEVFDEIQGRLNGIGGSFHLFSSVADGADLLACEVAIDKGIPIHVILPKPVSLFRKDFVDSEGSWARCMKIVEHAQSGSCDSTFRIAQVSSDDAICYRSVNADILETADVMVFLTNGMSSERDGGTSELIEQADSCSIPYIALNTLDPENAVYSNFNGFGRENFDEEGLEVIRGLNVSHCSKSTSDGSFAELWDNVEKVAMESSKWFRGSLTLSIVFHGLAAVIAGFAVSFSEVLPKGILVLLSAMELVFVGFALVLMLWHSMRKTQHKWIQHRFASELLRGFKACGKIIDPLFPRVRSHAPFWHRFALSSLLLANREAKQVADRPNLEVLKESYQKDRIDDQIRFFKKMHKKADPIARLYHHLGRWASWGALCAVLIALSYKSFIWLHSGHGGSHGHHEGLFDQLLIFVIFFLPVALPLIAGISNSLSSSLDLSRRQARYKKMVDLLEKQKKYIGTIKDIHILRRSVVKLEEILLDELMEWKTSVELGQSH